MTYANRLIEKTLMKLSTAYPAVLITGSRQVGKSTLLKHSIKYKNYITFDDPTILSEAHNDPKGFLNFYQYPLVIDEVQYLSSILKYLKIHIDETNTHGMYFLTGSQHFNLMQGVSESLAGRIAILELLGFSQREKFSINRIDPFIPTKTYLQANINLTNIKETQLWEMIYRGSYPDVVLKKYDPDTFYANYVKTYIERDVQQIIGITNQFKFIKFLTIVASRTAQVVNYHDLAMECEISEPTAKSWLSVLVTSNLIYLLQPYFKNIEKRVVKTPKMYFLDTGLAAYLTKWKNPDVLRVGNMSGVFFETYVISEIIKSYCNAGQTPPIYYYRDSNQNEIDLLFEENGTLFPIEIKKKSTITNKDIYNFNVLLSNKNVNVGAGGVICTIDKLAHIKNDFFSIPISYL